MMTFALLFHGLLVAIASLGLILCAFLLLECLAALPPASTAAATSSDIPHSGIPNDVSSDISSDIPDDTPGDCSSFSPSLWDHTSVAVLVPAHNEAGGIRQTLEQIHSQLKTSDRLVVVADNCTDETAVVAQSTGAIVLERHQLTQRGKGYALDHGLNVLSQSPPDVVVMIDADTQIAPHAIPRLVEAALRTQQPVQGAYPMTLPSGLAPAAISLKDRVTVFATTVKNVVRLQGLARLGCPVLLTGTGMAFPWSVLQTVEVASGSLVEDLKLGLDLALLGHNPTFCAEAQFAAALPQSNDAAVGQRTRWEHGRFAVTRHYLPRLLKAAWTQRRLGPLVLALDLSILPLSLLIVVVVGLIGVTAIWGSLSGLYGAFWITAVALGCLLLATATSWFYFGRQGLPLKQLLLVPFFILWKLPIYLQFVLNPQRNWIRTVRDPLPGTPLPSGDISAESPLTQAIRAQSPSSKRSAP